MSRVKGSAQTVSQVEFISSPIELMSCGEVYAISKGSEKKVHRNEKDSIIVLWNHSTLEICVSSANDHG